MKTKEKEKQKEMSLYDIMETLETLYRDKRNEGEGVVYDINIELDVFLELCRHLEKYSDLLEDLEKMLVKMDDTIKYNQPFDVMTPEK